MFVEQSRIEMNNNGELYDIYNAERDLAIQQFTGLKDKAGREIFEGDIVTYQLSESTSEHDTVRFVVEWGDCGWIMQDIDLKCCVGYLTCAIKTYEVIGNIFENPELCAK